MSAIADVLLAELTDEQLDRLAERLGPRLAARTINQPSRWLNVKDASVHLACTRSRLYALVSAGRIPFHKDGSRLLFRTEELDEWVRAGGGIRP